MMQRTSILKSDVNVGLYDIDLESDSMSFDRLVSITSDVSISFVAYLMEKKAKRSIGFFQRNFREAFCLLSNMDFVQSITGTNGELEKWIWDIPSMPKSNEIKENTHDICTVILRSFVHYLNDLLSRSKEIELGFNLIPVEKRNEFLDYLGGEVESFSVTQHEAKHILQILSYSLFMGKDICEIRIPNNVVLKLVDATEKGTPRRFVARKCEIS